MKHKLERVGTNYIPVRNVEVSAAWYVEKLGGELSYKDEDKAIINLADQSFFLVRAKDHQTANFIDKHGEEQFSLTFEVDGMEALVEIHQDFMEAGIIVGEIENRGHAGRNFVFQDLDGNKFDVWSELARK
ncbi:VOC family protein [Gracilibacillus ureilyticus]|uniref:VOC family protein n=1 Tax=Gracilibacillus ureilyticus TaxID=531814 RepID=UPI000B7DE849|nr:VOC family protein [Gracilibacillus ureilyticus]